MSASNQIMTQQYNQPALSEEVFEKVMLGQDLSALKPIEKVQYVNGLCKSLGLNPLTKPFEIMKFNGKEIPYARKDCTEQLRKINNVSIRAVETKTIADNIYIVTAFARLPDGREDSSTGAVSIQGLKGDALANAMMKAETKAKRRVTLSICGLGMLDESELDTMKGAQPISIVQPINEVIKTQIEIKDSQAIVSQPIIEKARDIDMDCMDIAWAEDLTRLQEIYTESYKYWVALRNKENLDRIIKAKDKRKSELESEEVKVEVINEESN